MIFNSKCRGVEFFFSMLIHKPSQYFSVQNVGYNTTKNTVISPNFLVWKFCAEAHFPHSFGRFARNYVETVPFRKISRPGN